MSIVLGAVEKDKICIGVDTLGIYDGGEFKKRRDKKIFKKGDSFIFAYTGSFRIGQTVKYNFIPPKQKDRVSDHKYLCTSFIDELKKLVSNEYQEEWSLMVGYNKNIYIIQSDFQVSFPKDNFDAEGAGYQYALSCYKLLSEYTELSIEEKISRSLQHTSYFNTIIKPPFNIEVLG